MKSFKTRRFLKIFIDMIGQKISVRHSTIFDLTAFLIRALQILENKTAACKTSNTDKMLIPRYKPKIPPMLEKKLIAGKALLSVMSIE